MTNTGGNFNVNSFSSIYQSINNWRKTIEEQKNMFFRNSSEFSGIVVSDDSNLAETTNNISAGINSLCNTLGNLLTSLTNHLQAYENQTLINEADVAKKVSEIDGILNSLVGKIESINIL